MRGRRTLLVRRTLLIHYSSLFQNLITHPLLTPLDLPCHLGFLGHHDGLKAMFVFVCVYVCACVCMCVCVCVCVWVFAGLAALKGFG